MTDLLARHQWAHRPPSRTPASIAVRQSRIWLHHGAAGASLISTARSYLDYHLDRRRWADIGYSWLIAEGKVLEGRGPGRAGAHTQGDNTASYGICMVGNFQTSLPDDRDLDALVWLLRHGVSEGWWSRPTLTGGHRDAPGASTSCPGVALWRHIPEVNRTAGRPDVEEDQMTSAQEAKLDAAIASVAELTRVVRDLAGTVGAVDSKIGTGRRGGGQVTVLGDLGRVRQSQRAIGTAVGAPVDNTGPFDGTAVVS